MRPVVRGAVPQVNGVNKTVSDYKDWRMDLIDRIGNYCSYCDMLLNDSPQVEHVSPKAPNPGLLLVWNNMLLACGPCNRAKSDDPYTTATHYIPDYHNTHLGFSYQVVPHPTKKNQSACIVIPRSDPAVNLQKALDTIDLCKLAQLTYNKRATDLRWKYRYEALVTAQLWRMDWDNWGGVVGQRFVALLVTAAQGKGFFSIWFDIFHDVPLVKQALINGFPNTDATSFDAANFYNPVVRVVGDL